MNKLKIINVKTSLRNYRILIKPGLFEDRLLLLNNLPGDCSKIFLITDNKVYSLYVEKIKKFLELSGLEHGMLILDEGEDQKNFDNVKKIYECLIDFNIHRNDTIIAFGGGVIGDIAGFAASTFHRGIRLIQFPTTMVSQIDSSIGGKTAININRIKNIAGTFYQPHLVIIDPFFLKSLPLKEIINGMAEMIKYGAVFNKSILTSLQNLSDKYQEGNSIEKIINKYEFFELIHKCCKIKADVVNRDEYDKDFRNFLNFGHTFGHSLEKSIGPSGISHGQAVAYGMLMAVDASIETGNAKNSLKQYFINIYKLLGIPFTIPRNLFIFKENQAFKKSNKINNTAATENEQKNRPDLFLPSTKNIEDKIIEAMQFDKKFSSAKNKFILLKDAGKPFFEYNLDENIIRKVIRNNISGEIT